VILHALELRHVGPFRDSVRLGPFAPGLNVLAAPNESGKTTALHATARALFDRHSTRSEEVKALQPAGTSLSPHVHVEFETRQGRFRLSKSFLQKPESQLHQWHSNAWQLVADADAADLRAQTLLQSTLPGRGATKPEHWGFLGFLWARQGEPASWPGLDDPDVGQRIRARLARVELDPVIEQLRLRLATDADTIFTATGLPRTGGPLRQAEDELATLDADLADLRRTRAELEETHRRFLHSEAEVARLEKELTERTTAASALRELSLAAERLRGELEVRQLALASAQEKLATLTSDADSMARFQRELAQAQSDLTQARTTAQTADKAAEGLRLQLDHAQSEQPKLEANLLTLRTRHQRLLALIKARHLSTSADALARQLRKSETAAATVTSLESRKSLLPTIAPSKLKKIEGLDEAARTLRAQLQALGLTVELTPEHPATLENRTETPGSPLSLDAGHTVRLQNPQSLDLHLGGWGRVHIRSGSLEASSVVTQLTQADTDLLEALQQVGVPTVVAARDAVAARKELDGQLKVAAAALAPLLGDLETLDDLRQAAATEARRAEAFSTALTLTEDERSTSLTDLEAAEAAQAERVSAAESTLSAFNQALARLRTDERNASQSSQQAEKKVSEQEARCRSLENQILGITHRYPDGLDTAKKAAQLAFAQAEARVVATRTELPPDFEKLPERNKRAAASLQQIDLELQTRRKECNQAQGTLITLGGQGLYSRETELEERRTEILLRRDAARARGWTTRLAHILIEHRKQAATKAVLAPLEQRLTTAFAELTGNSHRHVFLDEHLQIAGIGRTREETHAFEQLSQGAKEQLLLCLRLAVAQELAIDEPQVLILDDVLVNTDPVRQDRILDVLGAQTDRLQILILTCHPDRYRGVGQPITLSSAS
jgi:chromosome segregation ATPase